MIMKVKTTYTTRGKGKRASGRNLLSTLTVNAIRMKLREIKKESQKPDNHCSQLYLFR